ncbi:MAG: hypothetical protein LAT51_02820 [Flavobacteriaceae bacterium]|nr:hypothetical protein [Flavobacteriaceae bacterium]
MIKEVNSFLIPRLKKLFLSLENVEISYAYRTSTNTHIVEVKPSSIYRCSKKYIRKEMELERDFNNKFPSETLLFITEDSLTNIQSPDLVFKYRMNYNVDHFHAPLQLDSILVKNELSRAQETNLALAS